MRGRVYKRPRSHPVTAGVHVRVIGSELHLHMFQRSGDTPVGVPANMVQYAALMLMVEHLTGYVATTYYHTISDTHIYANQIPNVLTMLQRLLCAFLLWF